MELLSHRAFGTCPRRARSRQLGELEMSRTWSFPRGGYEVA